MLHGTGAQLFSWSGPVSWAALYSDVSHAAPPTSFCAPRPFSRVVNTPEGGYNVTHNLSDSEQGC